MTELASEIIKKILAQTDENSNSIALRNDDSITGAIEKPGILPLNAAWRLYCGVCAGKWRSQSRHRHSKRPDTRRRKKPGF